MREAYQQHIAQHCILIDKAVELLFQPAPGLDSLQNGHNVQLTPLQALILCCYCLRLPGWCRLRLLFAKLTILRQSNCAARHPAAQQLNQWDAVTHCGSGAALGAVGTDSAGVAREPLPI